MGQKLLLYQLGRKTQKLTNMEKIFEEALGIAHLKIMDKTSNGDFQTHCHSTNWADVLRWWSHLLSVIKYKGVVE